jgi:ATP-binding cassette subfamily F protein 3
VLLESLQEFTGTVVFVSHDRYFIENLATRVFEVGDGEVGVFPGNYADYLWRKQGGPEKNPTLKDVLIGTPPAEPIPMPSKAAGAAKRVNPMKLRQMREQAKGLEGEIQRTEVALSEFVSAEEAARLSSLLEAQRGELDGAMGQWEGLTQEIEATA